MKTPRTNQLMVRHSWLPFKIVNPETCKIMGLELGSIHLGYYDSKKGRIDLLRSGDFKSYMSITSDSAIPMNARDPNNFSMLTKYYIATLFEECYASEDKKLNSKMLDKVSSNIGISKSRLSIWVKTYAQ